MRSEEIQALISYRMQRAEESLQAAEIMLQSQMLTFAVNRYVASETWQAVQQSL